MSHLRYTPNIIADALPVSIEGLISTASAEALSIPTTRIEVNKVIDATNAHEMNITASYTFSHPSIQIQ